ncbi:MAG: Hpt domain-containing protein [Alphaproteobacteria bacterium]|jgi:chemotaxis protein histidine kinase CheA|nr:Hpt domain-containing protein [Alphaproteobacteria bacterium]
MGKASIRHASSEPEAISHPELDAIVDRLKGEYVEFASNTLVELDHQIEAGQAKEGANEEIVDAIRRIAHDLKGTGSSFGFPLISLLANRLEEYFIGRHELDPELLTDAQCFVNHMRGALEGRFDGVSEAEVVQTLPVKTTR